MGTNRYLIFFSISLVLALAGCKNQVSENNESDDTDSVMAQIETIKKARSIFYSMYLPSEMYKVFEKAGAVYDPEVLNPVENVNLYETSHKAALNLGVYGVDLSYNKMFGQNQKTLLYFAVIHKLSQQMGIPDNDFTLALKNMEKNLNNKDSLTKYATDIFSSTSKYLNDNERQAAAALIIAGGWVEAMYIATTISDQNISNSEIIDRIAFQKYSLNSLVSLMNNYQSDPVVNKYLKMLNALKRVFDRFQIYYEKDDLNLDTINKLINANKTEITLQKEDVKSIKKMVKQIRDDIVN